MGGFKHVLFFHFIYGNSPSQLTFICFASPSAKAPAGPGGGVQAPHRGNGLGLASGAERGEGGDVTRGEAARWLRRRIVLESVVDESMAIYG